MTADFERGRPEDPRGSGGFSRSDPSAGSEGTENGAGAIPWPTAEPDLSTILGEVRAPLELVSLLARLPALGRVPRGSGEPVMVIPGFTTTDSSTLILRSYLRRLGYRVSGWELGINDGNLRRVVPRLVERVGSLHRAGGEPVRLVGWSLGGVVAREVARALPRAIARVITLGSPVVGGAKYTIFSRLYAHTGIDLDGMEELFQRRERRPIQVPITAIYSRDDGIVDWRACIDRTNPEVDHVRVRAKHLAMGYAPEVLEIVARDLAGARRGQRD